MISKTKLFVLVDISSFRMDGEPTKNSIIIFCHIVSIGNIIVDFLLFIFIPIFHE